VGAIVMAQDREHPDSFQGAVLGSAPFHLNARSAPSAQDQLQSVALEQSTTSVLTPADSGREALILQLAAIAGDEPKTSLLEIRSRRRHGGMDQQFFPVRDLRAGAEKIMVRGRRTDTYVSAAPRTMRRGTADAVARCWTLWADCDSRESWHQLCAFQPAPSIVIRSSSETRVHAYWPLAVPVPGHWAQRSNRRLALALDADRQATSAATVLRPIGTQNFSMTRHSRSNAHGWNSGCSRLLKLWAG
jgi:hypothetical protein